MDDRSKGLVLAIASSVFIGGSFIVKKKALRMSAVSGIRAGMGGHSYLKEPLWWVGMISMVLGEFANFAAYAFAPAILVTPLGALSIIVSIIVSAILAHLLLDEKLHVFGWLGATLCVVGSIAIVLHSPQEKDIENVKQLWALATEPAFVTYSATALALSVFLITVLVPRYGTTNVLVYIAICSLLGSISVASCKALGIAVKLTLYGDNQLLYPETTFFAIVLAACAVTQINYLNKSLDTFNTAVVTPIYYVMFTTLTIVASVIMYKDWAGQTGEQVLMETCGFLTILIGTYLLHATKDFGGDPSKLHLFDPSARATPPKNSTPLKGHIGLGTMPSGGSKDDKEDLDPEAKPLL
ncbi:hypothetical protein CLOM_g13815 [Closterium sp. NIES-68]|nr:hypothetical protein CLOM_g23080 [Closterium sp. NIES-68]GJP54769.1 hypothetical protein CLOM_g13815 [Closterium sp. NIES-68]GJP61520.1 hypothetical protein CLOP_g18673 [Closterium sp. NIES-67]